MLRGIGFPPNAKLNTPYPRHNKELPGPCYKTDDTTLVHHQSYYSVTTASFTMTSFLKGHIGLSLSGFKFFSPQYPMHPTQETRKDLQSYILTGLSPSTVQPFQVNFSLTKKDPNQVQNTTSPHTSQYGIQFVLHRFRSPLLTISHIAFSSSTY